MTRWQPPETHPGNRSQRTRLKPGRFSTEPTEPFQAYRRTAGLRLGLAFGFIYTLVSQLINPMALPGIPLYQPPLGPFGNTVLGTLAGGAFGLICTWPASPAQGVILGAIVAAVAIFANTLLTIGVDAASTLASLFLSVPVAWVSVLVVAALRWLADRQVEARREAIPLLRRLRLPLILVVVLGFLAGFALHDPVARGELGRMNDLVQAGLRATDVVGLPAPLQGRGVTRFPAGAQARYTLEWTNHDLDRFIELRPASNYDQHAAVIARFTGGLLLVCLYPAPTAEPNCGTY